MLEVNPMQLIAAIKQGQNPQQLLLGILEGRMSNTPLGQNLLQMAKNNDTKGIEQAKQGYMKICNYKQELKKNFETQIFE